MNKNAPGLSAPLWVASSPLSPSRRRERHQRRGEGISSRSSGRRLSVFAGGWTFGATEAPVAGYGVEGEDVLDLLSGLVNKSLVVAEATGEGGVRYRMLEPIRQYAREKLEGSEEAEVFRRGHALWFLAFAEEDEPELRRERQGVRLARLETEHDNLRAALECFLEQKETEPALRLGGALRDFWHMASCPTLSFSLTTNCLEIRTTLMG